MSRDKSVDLSALALAKFGELMVARGVFVRSHVADGDVVTGTPVIDVTAEVIPPPTSLVVRGDDKLVVGVDLAMEPDRTVVTLMRNGEIVAQTTPLRRRLNIPKKGGAQ